MTIYRAIIPIVITSLLTAILVAVISTELNHNDKGEGSTITHADASAILAELKKISASLERIEKQRPRSKRAARPATAQVSALNRPAMGREDAPVTIVEYSDYQCPFCKRFVDNTMTQLKKQYIDTGKVRFVFKDMPLQFHQHANKAAVAAHCAEEQGKFWPMHDILFQNSTRLQQENLVRYATIAKLNIQKFNTCLGSNNYQLQIEQDIAEAKKAGISGTPTFVIGKTQKGQINGDVLAGAQPFASMKIIIDKHLGQSKP